MPVFCGGSGRSGTTIVARLVGAHPRYAVIPVEARFHTDRGGLPDLLEGRISLDRFLARMRTHWYSRTLSTGEKRGLHTVVPSDMFESCLSTFAGSYLDDPIRAARALVSSLFDPVAAAAGADAWIEMTPPNVKTAGMLFSLFPEMKVLHTVRDGRDVAARSCPCRGARAAWRKRSGGGPPS